LPFRKIIFCGYSHACEVDEGFENQLPNWNGIQDWIASKVVPIEGEFSLAHAGNPTASQSAISIPLYTSPNGKAANGT